MSEETIAQSAKDAFTESLQSGVDTAVAEVTAELEDSDTNPISDLIILANDKIEELEADTKRTKDAFVKFRNKAEIIIIRALIAAVAAGSATAIAKLLKKVS